MISRIVLSVAPLLFAGAAMAYDPYGGARPEVDVEPAQTYNRPPADIIDEGPGEIGGPAGPDAAALTMRVDRLERDLRRLTGQNEELQHKVQVLEDQLRAAKSEAPRASDAPARSAVPSTPAPAPSAGRRDDAFDPATDPTAPGAPRQLGTTQPSAPLANPPKTAAGSVTTAPPVREVGQPLDIAHGRLVGDEPIAPAEIAPPPPAAPPGPKEEYDEAVASLRAGRFEAAEKSLTTFLSKNPKSKFAPAATFNLGESFFLRGRHREAAEKYLEISTKYGQSAQAPDALLRLGQSLSAMGAKEQACASFSEIGVKYPNATARIKEAAQRESKKIQC
ncbi:tol-pal system protein YbgF [Methylocystis sp. WRRC1]|uniref:tol-pal system protein YbgF n=1 Tax=Methylocystis sp. WRRC1 TaxID=1732014 RepID=UPI001D1451EC|nr:tol-pal system protein YbgF [Methylocystis sp. WRRC1]MCC3243731.1 tol-pal system protein YbgF [Methylocystis sp. WRRC1]